MSAGVGVRQGVDTDVVCVTVDSTSVVNVVVAACSVERITEVERRTERRRSNETNVFRRFSTFRHYSQTMNLQVHILRLYAGSCLELGR